MILTTWTKRFLQSEAMESIPGVKRQIPKTRERQEGPPALEAEGGKKEPIPWLAAVCMVPVGVLDSRYRRFSEICNVDIVKIIANLKCGKEDLYD